MEAILGYNWLDLWLDLVTPQLLACGNVTKIICIIVFRKPANEYQVFGYPVGFT